MTQDGTDDQSVEIYLKQAEIARQRLAWDDAVKVYQIALRQAPDDRRLRLGLAQSYEAKAQQAGLKPMFLMALQEYWRLVGQDPTDPKLHDGLLAVAMKADRMEDTLAEYQVRQKDHPEVEAYKEAFKKLQALLLLRAEPVVAASQSPKGFAHTLMSRIVPFLFLGCLIGWLVVAMKMGPGGAANPNLKATAAVLSKSSFFLIAIYLGYQVFLRLRSSK